jgi:hypothetical protein
MSQLTDSQWYYFTDYARTTLNRIKHNNATREQLKDELVRVLRGSGRGGRIGGIPINIITQADAIDAANEVLDELIKPLVASAKQLFRQLVNQGWEDREAIADQLENHVLLRVQNPSLAVEIADNVLERQYNPAANLLDFTMNGFQNPGTISALTSVGLLLTLGLTWALFRKK